MEMIQAKSLIPYEGTSNLCEIEQESPLRYMFMRYHGDGEYEELNTIFKCQYYAQDHVWSSMTGVESSVHGYTVKKKGSNGVMLFPSEEVRIAVFYAEEEVLLHMVKLLNKEADQIICEVEAHGEHEYHGVYYVLRFPIWHKPNLPLINMVLWFSRLFWDESINVGACCKRNKLQTLLKEVDVSDLGGGDRYKVQQLIQLYPAEFKGLIKGLAETRTDNPYGVDVSFLYKFISNVSNSKRQNFGYEIHNGTQFSSILSRVFPDKKYGGSTDPGTELLLTAQLISIRRYINYEPSEKYLSSVYKTLTI